MSRIYFEKFLSEEDFEYFLQLAFNEETMVMNYGRVFSLEEARKFYKGIMSVNTKHTDLGCFKVFERTTDNFIGLGALSVMMILLRQRLNIYCCRITGERGMEVRW